MARPVRHDTDAILDAACRAVAEHGPAATIAQVGGAQGIPTGSIYHRFDSREELFVTLWLRSIRRLHASLIAAGESTDDPHTALLAIAVDLVRYCRAHPAEALSMRLYRQTALLEDGPVRLREQVASLNDAMFAVLGDLAARRFGNGARGGLSPLELVQVAVVQLPYGLVRPYLGETVPGWLDATVTAAVDAVLRLGDEDGPGRVRAPGR